MEVLVPKQSDAQSKVGPAVQNRITIDHGQWTGGHDNNTRNNKEGQDRNQGI